MKGGIGLRRGAVVLVIAFILDTALGARAVLFGVRPDITMAVLVPVCLLIGQASAAWLGLLVGALQGAFGAPAFGSLAVSRTATAWGVGLLEERLFRDNLLVAAAAGFCAVLCADVLLYAFAPQPDAVSFARHSFGRAVYTMALVVPSTIALRPLFRSRG